MTALFAGQVAVPLALILWMTLAAPRSASAFYIQLYASATWLWNTSFRHDGRCR